jgi:hypothetical protein
LVTRADGWLRLTNPAGQGLSGGEEQLVRAIHNVGMTRFCGDTVSVMRHVA